MRNSALLSIAVSMLVSNAWSQQQSVLISEVCVGTPDFIEIQNCGTAPVDISGWRVVMTNVSPGVGSPTGPCPFVFPTGTILASGTRAVVSESSLSGACMIFVTGVNYGPTSTASVEAALTDPSGAIVDYVFRWNNPAVAVTPLLQPGGTGACGLIPAASWTGILSGPGDGIHRRTCCDTDDASDWVVSPTCTPCGPSPVGGGTAITITSSPIAGTPDCQIQIGLGGDCSAGNQCFCLFYSFNDTLCPNGPVFGLDVPLPSLLTQLQSGLNFLPPFGGTLDANGDASFAFTLPCMLGIDVSAGGVVYECGTGAVLGQMTPVCNVIL